MCTHPSPVPGTPVSSPLSQQAARIASLATAANLVLCGDGLADRRLAETVALDLMDCAAVLAARLAEEADRLESATPEGA